MRSLSPLVAQCAAVALATALVAGCGPAGSGPVDRGSRAGDQAAPQLHVSGNQLLDAAGRRVVLHGVDRSGAEFQCVHGHGIWAGPVNQASVTAMRSWDVNAVRIPLNEACWNGQSTVAPADRGMNYQHAVAAYVRLLTANGLVVILDLHFTDGSYTGPWSQCRSAWAVCQKPMPDAAQAIGFWRSVAATFRGNDAVIFDLFNEPFPRPVAGSEAGAWHCWRWGGWSCAGIGYQVAGMQALVTAVRSTGADNVIMLGGIQWANDLGQWLQYAPDDPDHNLVASWHSYQFRGCSTVSCWDTEIAPLIRKVPVIAGEIGEKDCRDTYVGPLMRWLDAHRTGYLAWAWNADFGCSQGPSLITSYTGTPTPFGAGYRAHLRALG